MEKLTNGRKCDQSRDDDRERSCQLRGEEVEIFSIPKVRVFVRFFTGGGIFFYRDFSDSTVSGGVGRSGVGSPGN